MKDYSEIENFNLAAIEAVNQAKSSHKAGDKEGEVVYIYKGRNLKVCYDAFLNEDGSLDYIGITNVEQVKE